MTLDLARLCESMRDRLYSIGATAIGNPGVALAQALDAAATELRRQREAGAAGLSAKLDVEVERQQAENTLRHAAAVYGANAPSASPTPAEERESVARGLQAAFATCVSDADDWYGLDDDTRDGYRAEALYVLNREATLRAERDTLRAEVERLTAELAAMRPVVQAAREWCSKWDRNAAALGDAVHEYERARLKAQEPPHAD